MEPMSVATAFHPNLYLIFEISAFVSYALILAREIRNRNKGNIFEIVSCTFFGLILEIGDTYLAHTYSYSDNFLVQIFHVPLAIGFGWAVIIYCAMLLSDEYNIPWFFRPFMDALTALTLDLAMDAIAIRLGFWHWIVPLNAEWYGVPFENLFGWIMVVLSFSFCVRFIRTLNPKRFFTRILMIFSPLFAYAGLTLGLIVFSVVAIVPYAINNWSTLIVFHYHPDIAALVYSPEVSLWKLIVLLVVVVELINIVAWAMVRYRRNYLREFDILSFVILSGLYIFFFAALFISGIAREAPVLVVLTAIFFCVHCFMHFLPYFINRKTIYFFKRAEKSFARGEKKMKKIVDTSLR
jgi:hypothetical protein